MLGNRYSPIKGFKPKNFPRNIAINVDRGIFKRKIAIDIDRDIFNDVTALRAYVSILRAQQDKISVEYFKDGDSITEDEVLKETQRPKFGFIKDNGFLPNHINDIYVLTNPRDGYLPVSESDLVCISYKSPIDQNKERLYWGSKDIIVKSVKRTIEISDSELGFLARYGLKRLLINFGTIDSFLDNWRPINSWDLK